VLTIREEAPRPIREAGRIGGSAPPALVDAATVRAVAAAFRVRRLHVVWPSGGAPPASLEELRLEGVGVRGLGVLAARKREGVLARLRKVDVRVPGDDF
jgi:hypothetical protein